MNTVKHWAMALMVGAALTVPMVASAMEAPSKEITTGPQRYKEFTLPSFAAGQCMVEEGANVTLFADGRLHYNAVLNCKEPYRYSYAYTPYGIGTWNSHDDDLEIVANFVGAGTKRFDEEFDADIGVDNLHPLASKDGSYRYLWKETRPANHRRSHRYPYITNIFMALD